MSTETIPANLPMQHRHKSCFSTGRASIVTPGVFVYNDGKMTTPIFCSCYDTGHWYGARDNEDGFILAPGYKAIAYTNGSYTSGTVTFDNTNGSKPLISHTASYPNRMSSVKIYFKNQEIRQTAFESNTNIDYFPTGWVGAMYETRWEGSGKRHFTKRKAYKQSGGPDNYASGTSFPTQDQHLTGEQGDRFRTRGSIANPGAYLLNWVNTCLPIYANLSNPTFFNDMADRVILLAHYGIRCYEHSNYTGWYHEYKNNTDEVVQFFLQDGAYSSFKLFYNNKGFSTTQNGYFEAIEEINGVTM